jgi:hypothetical protein
VVFYIDNKSNKQVDFEINNKKNCKFNVRVLCAKLVNKDRKLLKKIELINENLIFSVKHIEACDFTKIAATVEELPFKDSSAH